MHPAHDDSDRPPRLLPTIVVGGVVAFVALTFVSWVIGTVLAALRTAVVLAVIVAVVWAVAGSRSRR